MSYTSGCDLVSIRSSLGRPANRRADLLPSHLGGSRGAYPVIRSKRTSGLPLPNTAWNRKAGCFVFSILHRNRVKTEQVPILRYDLARQLHSGLLLAPNAEEYPEKLGAGEGLRALRKQPLARPKLRRELLEIGRASCRERV